MFSLALRLRIYVCLLGMRRNGITMLNAKLFLPGGDCVTKTTTIQEEQSVVESLWAEGKSLHTDIKVLTNKSGLNW